MLRNHSDANAGGHSPAKPPTSNVAVNAMRNVTNTHAKPDFGMLCKYMRIVRCSTSAILDAQLFC